MFQVNDSSSIWAESVPFTHWTAELLIPQGSSMQYSIAATLTIHIAWATASKMSYKNDGAEFWTFLCIPNITCFSQPLSLCHLLYALSDSSALHITYQYCVYVVFTWTRFCSVLDLQLVHHNVEGGRCKRRQG
jgi:hypothetical protein